MINLKKSAIDTLKPYSPSLQKGKVKIPPTLNPPSSDTGDRNNDDSENDEDDDSENETTPTPSTYNGLQPMVLKDRKYFRNYLASPYLLFTAGGVIVSCISDNKGSIVGYIFYNSYKGSKNLNISIMQGDNKIIEIPQRKGVFCIGDNYTVVDIYGNHIFIKDKKYFYLKK